MNVLPCMVIITSARLFRIADYGKKKLYIVYICSFKIHILLDYQISEFSTFSPLKIYAI